MAVLATPSRALQIAAAARVVAVLGARTDASRTRPAFYVADFLSNDGVRVIPLPVSPPTGPSSEEGSFPGNAPPLPGGLAALASTLPRPATTGSGRPTVPSTRLRARTKRPVARRPNHPCDLRITDGRPAESATDNLLVARRALPNIVVFGMDSSSPT